MKTALWICCIPHSVFCKAQTRQASKAQARWIKEYGEMIEQRQWKQRSGGSSNSRNKHDIFTMNMFSNFCVCVFFFIHILIYKSHSVISMWLLFFRCFALWGRQKYTKWFRWSDAMWLQNCQFCAHWAEGEKVLPFFWQNWVKKIQMRKPPKKLSLSDHRKRTENGNFIRITWW